MKNILYFASNLDFNLSNGASIVEFEQIKLLQQNHKIKVINFIDDKTYLNQKSLQTLDYQEIELKKNIFNQPDYPKTLDVSGKDFDFVVFTSSFQINFVPLFSSSKKIYVISNTDYQQNKHAFLNVDNKEENLCGLTDINIFLTQKDFLYFKSLGLVRKNDIIISPFINNQNLTNAAKILNQALITTNLDNKHNQESLLWFLKEVYPKVDATIKLVITGKGVFSELKNKYPNVDFRGFVTRDELILLYNESSLFINPTISGSGVQIKLLEALSYNMNVVSTEYTNTFPHIIDSSNNSIEFASLINEHIQNPNHTFNFEEYNKVNCKNFLRIFEL